jgi:ketosteroid isomerase-like protein
MSHPNEDVIKDFYTAFSKRDAETMAAQYHEKIHFSDPVFPDLDGPQAGAMWAMLCERGKDLEITFGGVEADDTSGKARWEAHYTFSATGNKVHNIIDATFRFEDGKIIDHKDQFDLYKWSKQALGVKGLLLGWAPPVQNAVRAQAAKGLEIWMSKNP